MPCEPCNPHGKPHQHGLMGQIDQQGVPSQPVQAGDAESPERLRDPVPVPPQPGPGQKEEEPGEQGPVVRGAEPGAIEAQRIEKGKPGGPGEERFG